MWSEQGMGIMRMQAKEGAVFGDEKREMRRIWRRWRWKMEMKGA
jgi:hypothetical protein